MITFSTDHLLRTITNCLLFSTGCDKIKVRGHKCSFRVKLTMRLGFVDHWFVEILGSHNCYIEDGDPPNDMDKMLADYENKSSDGEEGSFSPLMRASPLADTNSMMAVSQNSASFVTSSSSPPQSMLLSQAHCPLNVPLFPESYLMTVARNAAAAVAMSNGNGLARGQPSPLSLSIKHDRSPSDLMIPEIMNGLLPPSIIPRFGVIPSSSSPPTGDNGHSPNTPVTDVMDLSTPKIKEENGPRDLSFCPTTSAPETKYSTGLSRNGHGSVDKTSFFLGGKHLSDHLLNKINKNRSHFSNIPDSSEGSSSGSPKCNFNSIPSSASPKSSLMFPSQKPPTSRYIKGNFRSLKPFQLPHQTAATTDNTTTAYPGASSPSADVKVKTEVTENEEVHIEDNIDKVED